MGDSKQWFQNEAELMDMTDVHDLQAMEAAGCFRTEPKEETVVEFPDFGQRLPLPARDKVSWFCGFYMSLNTVTVQKHTYIDRIRKGGSYTVSVRDSYININGEPVGRIITGEAVAYREIISFLHQHIG